MFELIKKQIDISEDAILAFDPVLLDLLLKDQTTGTNIIWATDHYAELGDGYAQTDLILPERITGEHCHLIQPRVAKSKEEQVARTRDNAEVFTPSWVCNVQNNLIDRDWFGRNAIFNKETEQGWVPYYSLHTRTIPKDKTWQEYVLALRLEISCGEAPYLCSRYDTVTGRMLKRGERIGLLDRKLYICADHNRTYEEWYQWVLKAYQSTYGYEYQGDNLLLARENLMMTFIDWSMQRYRHEPSREELREIATILSWNLFQMDGIKYVVPMTCHDYEQAQGSLLELLGETSTKSLPCPGCAKDDIYLHNGVIAQTMDWVAGKPIRFRDILKEEA